MARLRSVVLPPGLMELAVACQERDRSKEGRRGGRTETDGAASGKLQRVTEGRVTTAAKGVRGRFTRRGAEAGRDTWSEAECCPERGKLLLDDCE
jgi:hypothetical protein